MRATTTPSDLLPLVKRFVQTISEQQEIKEVWLFGSAAQHQERKYKDVDIAVIVSEPLDFAKETDLRLLGHQMVTDAELHFITDKEFQDARSALIDDIKTKGMRLS